MLTIPNEKYSGPKIRVARSEAYKNAFGVGLFKSSAIINKSALRSADGRGVIVEML